MLINAVSNGNKRAFAHLVGVTPTVIENIVGKRQGKPGYNLLEKISFAIENLNPNWLLTGEGSMLRSDDQEQSSPHPSASSIPLGEDSFIYKMYEKEKLENKLLIEEIGSLKERIRTLESQEKEPDCPTAASLMTEAFTSDSSVGSIKGSSPTKRPAGSKRSLAGKI